MDGQGESLFASLEASFEAQLCRADDEAASDFAFNLLQDRDLVDALTRSGARVLLTPSGTTLPLTEVGSNYALGERNGRRVLVPIHLVASHPADRGRLPVRRERTMLRLLREEVLRNTKVELDIFSEILRGKLVAAGKDHLRLQQPEGQTVIALAAIRAVTLLPLGSGDEP